MWTLLKIKCKSQPAVFFSTRFSFGMSCFSGLVCQSFFISFLACLSHFVTSLRDLSVHVCHKLLGLSVNVPRNCCQGVIRFHDQYGVCICSASMHYIVVFFRLHVLLLFSLFPYLLGSR